MTAFNTWMTRFDETATLLPSFNKLPLQERLVKESRALLCMVESGSMDEKEALSESLRLGEEYLWLLDGKPYFTTFTQSSQANCATASWRNCQPAISKYPADSMLCLCTVKGHSHAHIRTGHLHAVRCGPGKRDVKIRWFRPTVVRPDLPFAVT